MSRIVNAPVCLARGRHSTMLTRPILYRALLGAVALSEAVSLAVKSRLGPKLSAG